MSRLIDADEFKLENKRLLHCDFPYLSEITLEELIDDAPTIDAVPVRHGHWIPGNTPDAFWVCSYCGFPSEAHGAFKLYKYCPQCGTLMDEVTE